MSDDQPLRIDGQESYPPRMRLALVVALAGLACGDSSSTRTDAGSVDAAITDGAGRHLGVLDFDCAGQPGRPRVLVYTYENLFRHVSSYYARAVVNTMCMSHGFTVQSTNDPRAINSTRLANVDVIVFAVTSGSALSDESKRDLEAWIRAGGGLVGFEAAAATEMDWPFFEQNLGDEFLTHSPGVQEATVRLETNHPITQGMPSTWVITEQWYVFKGRPENVPGLHVLMTLDEATLPADYPPAFKVGNHPIGWAYEPFGGRVFYTGLGDRKETFDEPMMVEIIGRAIEWTARTL